MIDFKIFNNLNKHNLEYRDIKFYFCLGGANFWHFFYEQLLNIYQITPERLFCLGTNYFTPLYHQRLNYENSKVLVYPHVISGGRLLNEEVEQDYPKLGNKIYSDSIQNYKEYIDEDNCNFDLIIWLGLVYRKDNKKTWLNQQDSILCIFYRLLQNIKGKKVKIYIDGFKAYENGTFREESNELMISQLSMALSSFQFKVVSLHGKTMKEAISCCSDCHVAIAEAGSGGIIPIFCCNKPTILYGNLTYINRIARYYKNFPNVKIIEKDFINEVELPKNSNQWFGERNYFIQWQHIYDLLLNMLINIKNIPIQDNFSQIQNLNQTIETKNQIIQDKDNIIFCKDISLSFQSKYG
ncbi:hypothetical protein FUD28_07925, partial [Campylobacter coli]|nr:hypothetical protein [Campylobacter coli]